jgi:hypothetical protein
MDLASLERLAANAALKMRNVAHDESSMIAVANES